MKSLKLVISIALLLGTVNVFALPTTKELSQLARKAATAKTRIDTYYRMSYQHTLLGQRYLTKAQLAEVRKLFWATHNYAHSARVHRLYPAKTKAHFKVWKDQHVKVQKFAHRVFDKNAIKSAWNHYWSDFSDIYWNYYGWNEKH